MLHVLNTRKLEIAANQNDIISKLKSMYRGNLVSPSASPTFLINGKTYDGGRDAESIKQELCVLFDNAPVECKESLSNEEEATGNC